ncbi:hypothetical protein KIN20_038432 [Parelaphostrongylus tenuis]|uniref:Uncharacterized protein n=1 Tax=Parelaphostrongylus tenuis TaxID=148309 RepID=A0AAD5QUJ3_PARTN|nr:hypothetical protein KIN20_038432 [Parelaphostrongylus tenuis]
MSETLVGYTSSVSRFRNTSRGFPTAITSTPKGGRIIYCNDYPVYIVDVENITGSDIYEEHSVLTIVAKMSTSRYIFNFSLLLLFRFFRDLKSDVLNFFFRFFSVIWRQMKKQFYSLYKSRP